LIVDIVRNSRRRGTHVFEPGTIHATMVAAPMRFPARYLSQVVDS